MNAGYSSPNTPTAQIRNPSRVACPTSTGFTTRSIQKDREEKRKQTKTRHANGQAKSSKTAKSATNMSKLQTFGEIFFNESHVVSVLCR
jgi:hypothetical protein